MPDADHQTMQEVATRLGKSTRWLQVRLTDDSRRPAANQKLQTHHFIGRSKRWSEAEYQALVTAIIAADTQRSTISSGRYQSTPTREADAALDRLLAMKPGSATRNVQQRNESNMELKLGQHVYVEARGLRQEHKVVIRERRDRITLLPIGAPHAAQNRDDESRKKSRIQRPTTG